jgi:hypothetical protein
MSRHHPPGVLRRTATAATAAAAGALAGAVALTSTRGHQPHRRTDRHRLQRPAITNKYDTVPKD